ncbi:hypothetical protein BD626DRAFT_569021 [Schizophyllum amplum]|uniref:Uncharacterized protein n=1 Tax=Schizophyllum amplum TaxID=97359 RepID=A0A550CFQ5_9AGAR|nr:hypothetical protein BD626DRAFT_569021 [Auriculariopsis ampla]
MSPSPSPPPEDDQRLQENVFPFPLDPVLQFMQQQQQQQRTDVEPESPEQQTNADSDLLSATDRRAPEQQASTSPVYVAPLSLMPVFPELRTRLQAKLALDSVAMNYLDELAEASSLQEMHYINGAAVMKIEQMLRLSESAAARHKQWVFSESLKEKATSTTRILLVSPKLPAYRGTGIQDVVYKMLKNSHSSHLPKDEDQHNVKIVKKHIRDTSTLFRNSMKAKLGAFLDPKSQASKNIVDVCASVVSPIDGVEPTLAMLTRFAFIRWHIDQYKDHTYVSKEGFWMKVDHTLRTFAVTYKSQAELDAAFALLYNKEKHRGDPADSAIQTQDPSKVPDWVEAIYKASKEVQNSTDLDDDPAETHGQKPTKRKRTDAA